jgi:hypothetical protein
VEGMVQDDQSRRVFSFRDVQLKSVPWGFVIGLVASEFSIGIRCVWVVGVRLSISGCLVRRNSRSDQKFHMQ